MLKTFRFNFYLRIFRENMRINALLYLLLFLNLLIACEVNAMGNCIKGDCVKGEGTYRYADGSEYSGQWKNDNFHGKGRFAYSDSSVYIGQWKNSKRDGEGTYTSPSGSIYKGQWKNDKFEGQGSYFYQDGSQYQGRWKNNMRNGQGSYTAADGTKYQGQWINGKLIGKGVLITPDGEKYIGQFNRDGKLIGQYKPLLAYETAVKKKANQEHRTKADTGQKTKEEAKIKTEPVIKVRTKTKTNTKAKPIVTTAGTETGSKTQTEPSIKTRTEAEPMVKGEAATIATTGPETIAKTGNAKKENEIAAQETSNLPQDNQAAADQYKKTMNGPNGMKFVYISPGSFTMGSPQSESGRYDNEIQHSVTLTQGYYLQITEVTQGQWKSVMGNNPSFFNGCGDSCPVEQVSWNDVQQFIWRLNQMEGADKYRLPTEAEWEYACRAGTTTSFFDGEINVHECDHDANLASMAWYCGNSGKKSHPVAQKKANAWGLHDMQGNISELCQDWYGEYPPEEVADPKGKTSGLDRTVRGGGWGSHARHCRSACRGAVAAGESTYDVGLRLVRMP